MAESKKKKLTPLSRRLLNLGKGSSYPFPTFTSRIFLLLRDRSNTRNPNPRCANNRAIQQNPDRLKEQRRRPGGSPAGPVRRPDLYDNVGLHLSAAHSRNK